MPPQLGSPRMLAGPVPREDGRHVRPSPHAGRRARFADSRFEPESPCDVTCSASAGRSVSSSKNVSPRPNRKHLVLVGAQGARRGGGTGTTHFPYEQFQPLTTLASALPATYIPRECSAQPTELPVLPKTALPLPAEPRLPGAGSYEGMGRAQKQDLDTRTFPNITQLGFSPLKLFF